jgi:chromosome partitioning protein
MPGRIVLIGNEKGGCGKTTLAVNLAAMAASDGQKTLLVDADPGQQSAARWAARRLEAVPQAAPVVCVSLHGRGISTGLADFAKLYDVIVVDTGAEDSPELRGAAIEAHVLVVPLQPESLDLWTMPTIETIFQRAQQFNPTLRMVVAINRVPHQLYESAPTEVRGWLSENVPNIPLSAVVSIVSRTAYGRAIADGLGVAEMSRRDPKAVTEMDRLFRQVMA